MNVPGIDGAHLTYCTNIHPGETWAAVRANLERYVLPVRERVAHGVPFGLGLRLSAEAARTLAIPDQIAALLDFFHVHDLYAFTINGFPYGAFHGQRVKERVYLPDWLDEARLAYTDQLADILAGLLHPEVEGTISTVPGAFHSRIRSDEEAGRVAAMMARHAAHLLRLRETTGKRLALAIEPEPWCAVDTVASAISFFEQHLFGRAGVDELRRHVAIDSTGEAESVLRSLVGVCFDICHMAVEFEEPAAALAAFGAADIRVAKVQVSAGLRARLGGGDEDVAVRAALSAFADDVYLHQVVERDAAGRLARYLDLPQALEAAAAAPAADSPREWRIHFHVPLFLERLGVFESTQDYVRETLQLLRDEPRCAHYEVETYTWDVIPAEHRNVDVVTAVAREMEWTLAQLGGAPAEIGPKHRLTPASPPLPTGEG